MKKVTRIAENNLKKVFEHYSVRYSENMNGEKPPKWNKIDLGACKLILQEFGIDRVLDIIDNYFIYKPNNSIRDGYPFNGGYSSVCFLSAEIDSFYNSKDESHYSVVGQFENGNIGINK